MYYYQDVIRTAAVTIEKVEFKNQGITLAGLIFKPSDKKLQQSGYPAIIVGHPAGGVKEQTASVYAVKLAERGFLTLAFDAAYQGESGGEPRYLEDPGMRVEDFRCAVDYLSTRADVEADAIGILGMCAAGGYVIKAAGTDTRMKAIATVSMADLGDMFRNGLGRTMKPEELQGFLAQIAAQRTREAAQGAPVAYMGYVADSEAELAGKARDWWDGYEYYRTSPARHPRSVNKMILSHVDRLIAFTALEHVELLGQRPLLAVAGTEAGTKYFAEEAVAQAIGPKELFWVKGSTHIELYYKEPYVDQAIERLDAFFKKYLKESKK